MAHTRRGISTLSDDGIFVVTNCEAHAHDGYIHLLGAFQCAQALDRTGDEGCLQFFLPWYLIPALPRCDHSKKIVGLPTSNCASKMNLINTTQNETPQYTSKMDLINTHRK